MNFETTLFAVAFAMLGLISLPDKPETHSSKKAKIEQSENLAFETAPSLQSMLDLTKLPVAHRSPIFKDQAKTA